MCIAFSIHYIWVDFELCISDCQIRGTTCIIQRVLPNLGSTGPMEYHCILSCYPKISILFSRIFLKKLLNMFIDLHFDGPWPAFSFSWCMSSSRRCTDCSVKQLWYSSSCQAVHGPRLSIKSWLFVALASCPIGSHL